MKKELLNELISSVEKQELNVLNVVVRQNGIITAKHDFKEEKPVLLWSVSKTVTSMAVGIAVGEGYFNLGDSITEFFSGYAFETNENIEKITVHDLLCMGTGQAECPVMKADWGNGATHDICRLFFDEPVIFEPGTHFAYNNAATYMLSKIISVTTGIDLDIYSYEKILKHLDIPKPRWDTCPNGIPQGFSGLYLTAGQLSKFGQLILDKGVWKGMQIIPSGYIEKAVSVQIKTDDFNPFFATEDHHRGYGYQIWMNSYPNSYRMDGSYGQYVVMLPDKNAVVTYVSDESEKMTNILELTWDNLVDKL